MSPENRYTQIRRTELGANPERALRAATNKTSTLLTTWRSRFTAGNQIAKAYTVGSSHVALHSPTPATIQADIQHPEQRLVYDFDNSSQVISRQEFDADGNAVPSDGTALQWHDELSRALFDCDEQERLG